MRGRLGANIVANALGFGLTALAGVASAPLIYRAFGPEAYGLVGVYLMLQAFMPLFDLGVTPGVARAIAWHRGRDETGAVLTLLRIAHLPVASVALVFVIAMLAFAAPLSQAWFQPKDIPADQLAMALVLMTVALALRMLGALNRGALMALERQAEANIAQTSAALARTFGALGFAVATGSGVMGFLALQIPVSLVEWWWSASRLRRALPGPASPVDRVELKRHLRFALGIAGLAALWLLTSQVDKLVLSKVLALDDYGRFSLGVHMAMVVSLGVAAIHGAVLPRLTRLFSAGEDARARQVYGLATALSIAVAAAAGLALFVGGPSWLGRMSVGQAGSIDPLAIGLVYACAQGALALLGLAYLLQSARGVLRLHAAMTIAQAVIIVPLVVVLATRDAMAVAVAIMVVHWLFVVAWLPVPHRAHLAGGHLGWLCRDVLPAAGAAVMASVIPLALSAMVDGPWADTLLALCGAGLVFCAACASHAGLRGEVRAWWGARDA